MRSLPLLIVFRGLSGTGKTTLAKVVAKHHAAIYLRIDTIEAAIYISNVLRNDVGPAGYAVAYRLAEENLRLGNTVVADSVNPLQITRDAWAQVARTTLVAFIEVEVICSDATEHRRRIESRPEDCDGLPPITWKQVCERTYEKSPPAHIVIDTARKSISEAQQELLDKLTTLRNLPER